MDRGLRILVASPLGRIVAPSVAAAFPAWEIDVAEDRESVRRQVIGRVRFDVVIADLVWNNPELEFTFDGLDVIDVLHEANRLAPVILARQGHSMELDLLDEARLRPEVVSVFHKSAGTGELPALIRDAAVGKSHHSAGVPQASAVRVVPGTQGTDGRTHGRCHRRGPSFRQCHVGHGRRRWRQHRNQGGDALSGSDHPAARRA